MEDRPFGWRELLRSVNLRDFAQMVRGELAMIGSSFEQGVRALPRMPFGPLVFLGFMLLAFVRSMLLFLVVLAFGSVIALISLLRGISGLGRGAAPPDEGG